jgi:hypothetical protein
MRHLYVSIVHLIGRGVKGGRTKGAGGGEVGVSWRFRFPPTRIQKTPAKEVSVHRKRLWGGGGEAMASVEPGRGRGSQVGRVTFTFVSFLQR